MSRNLQEQSRMLLQSGSTLCSGRYVIDNVMGVGDFTITYGAHTSIDNAPFVIKEFFLHGRNVRNINGRDVVLSVSIEKGTYERYLHRFIEEANLRRQVQHPALIPINDVFAENNTAYYVMPFANGESLRTVIQRQGALPYGQAINYAHIIGEALTALHNRNLIHRSVTPDNILFKCTNETILVDYGSPREYPNDPGKRQSSWTPGFTAIEQYNGQPPMEAYTDVYDMAATLYYMLTGQIPVDSTLRNTNTLAPVEALNPQVPKSICDMIMSALSLYPFQRPQNVSVLLAGLPKAEPVSMPTPPPLPPQPDYNAARLAEQQRIEEQKRAEAARIAEQQRLDEQRRAEAARIAEQQRLDEQRRAEEARLAEQRRLEEQRRAEEEARLAEQQHLEEQRRAEEARLAEQQRLEEQRRAEEARLAEQRRLEEQRRAEEARLAEQRRLEEQRRAEEEARLAEQKRQEEMRRLAEEQKRKAEEELKKQENLWNTVAKQNSINNLQAFVSQYPNNKHVQEAKVLINKLWAAQDEATWKKCAADGSKSSMKAYLKKFGTNGKHIQEAKAVVKKKNRVVVLILAIILLLLAGGAAAYYFLRPTEAKAWNAASSENTYAAYQNYLNAYGNAVESEAKAHQDKAKTNMLKLSKDNPDQLNEIAKLYPNTDYAQEATIRLTEINLDSLRTFIPIISELNMNFEEPIKKLNRYYSATQNTLNDMQIELPSELRNDIMLTYEELNAVVSNQLQSNLNAAKAFKNDAEIFNPAMANVRSLIEYLGLDSQLKATTTMQLDKLQK